ncbi:hypothetical protein Ahy_B04g073576 [Arachis hypogaea]|uniref:PB1-like domain-containing protein n=1 Tax=Arachis hypogaea TaxID=3818 RepID=A0A444ZQV3_ARAHY|nr:hypothetical protein Ahy_B04g073576 [Arachis hypogaea]
MYLDNGEGLTDEASPSLTADNERKFETDLGGSVIYTFDLYDEWVGVDKDYLDVFVITSYYRELGYDKAEACWFLDPKDGLEFGLRRLQVD